MILIDLYPPCDWWHEDRKAIYRRAVAKVQRDVDECAAIIDRLRLPEVGDYIAFPVDLGPDQPSLFEEAS